MTSHGLTVPHRLNSAYHLCRLPFTSIQPNRHTHIHSQSFPHRRRHRRRHLNRHCPGKRQKVESQIQIQIK